jgi:tetratricopeptide (TPR) repeat protein
MYPKAIAAYDKVFKLDPDNREAPLYVGAVYAEQKQYDKAVSYFENLAKNPEYSTPHMAYYYIGRVRMEQTSWTAAEAAFKKSLSSNPDFVDAVLALGQIYTKNKNEEKAIALYKTFDAEQGPHLKVSEILAQYHIDREEYDEAFVQLKKMEPLAEDPLNIQVKMALILIEKSKLRFQLNLNKFLLKKA